MAPPTIVGREHNVCGLSAGRPSVSSDGLS